MSPGRAPAGLKHLCQDPGLLVLRHERALSDMAASERGSVSVWRVGPGIASVLCCGEQDVQLTSLRPISPYIAAAERPLGRRNKRQNPL